MIQKLLKDLNVNKIRDYVKQTPIATIATELEALSAAEIIIFLRMLNTDDAAEIFSYFDKEIQWLIIEKFADNDHQNLINQLQSDELADILDEMPANIAKKLLKTATPQKRRIINQLLNYEDNQVGSIMAVDIALIKENYNCSTALSQIKTEYQRNNAELVHYYYVIDRSKKLVGSVTLEDIVFSEPTTKITEIIFPVAKLKTSDLTDEAIKIFAEQDMSVLPVVNVEDIVVGMVTSDDIIDAINEAATEDIYKMAAISDINPEKPYLKKSSWEIVKSRIFWLIILMIGSTLSQIVIELFTNVMKGYIASGVISTAVLVAMIPVISGAAGNAGSQSSTTITRAFALGEIGAKDYRKIMFKEFKVSLITGLILFAVNFARLIVYFIASKALINHPLDFTLISLASSFALFCVIVFSKILGTIIPVIAIKIKKDPAVMSAPLLSTLSDAISTLIFFGITLLVLLIHIG